MTTLVTAFISKANTRNDRNTENYIEYGKKLLKNPIKKIVFFEETLIKSLEEEYFNENTIIIPVRKEDNYLYKYIDLITNFGLTTTQPDKDTLEYMLLICNKTEFIRKAIEINPFNTKQFIWVDFGINHIFKNDEEKFNNVIKNLDDKMYETVRIGSIWTPEMYHVNLYTNVAWFFAGGVFGGDLNSLIKFADLTKKMCIKTIEEHQTIMWEVNIWYQVYLENKELFSPYNCDHNYTLIENY
jgi:hypothetical protein